MRLKFSDFKGGVNTYKNDDQLSPNEARVADDCFVGDGALTPIPEIELGDPTGIDLDRFNDSEQCGYVEWDGDTYNGCDLSDLGLPQPRKPVVSQGDTPAVIGPSEDGSGSFNSVGEWEQTELTQTNVWTSVINDTEGVFGDPGTTTVSVKDSWVVCDTPSFNITEYYALALGNPTLAKSPPTLNKYGCVIGATGGGYIIGPGDEFVPKYFTENTSYAVSFYNEDLDIESTVSDIAEFEHSPYIVHQEWSYGPLQGDTEGKTWFPEGFIGQSTVVPANSSTDPSELRGNRRQTVRYTGTSHLHQVKVNLPWHHNATHVILYMRVGGSLTAVAKGTPGGTLTVRPDGVFNGGSDLSLDSSLSLRRPVFTLFEGPPSSLTGITVNAIGIMVGFKGDKIYISQPNSGFHLWNPLAQFTLKYTPVSVHSIYNEFLITTTGSPFKITGSDPSTMIPIEMPDLEFNLDWRSAANAGRMVMWAGPNGVSAYDGREVRPITRGRLSYSDWKSIRTSDDLVGVASEEVYLLFHDSGALVVDMRPESQAITNWNITATKAVYAVEEGYIYLSGGRKFRLDEALTTEDSDTEGTWTSGRIYIGNTNTGLAWMRGFSKGTVDVKIVNDQNQEAEFSISSPAPQRIGFGDDTINGEWIQVTARFHHRVTGIELASDINELQV